MLGIGLGELVVVIFIFGLAAWLLSKASPPWNNYGLWLLGIFAVIYLFERLHIYDFLQKIMI